ncbi:hypothetical protein B0H19DRAFT_1161438 [Mycena capillaripes]|nr:hypothetical protein B0H19DRAFT_1161438 [Mycena capillaripes]
MLFSFVFVRILALLKGVFFKASAPATASVFEKALTRPNFSISDAARYTWARGQGHAYVHIPEATVDHDDDEDEDDQPPPLV